MKKHIQEKIDKLNVLIAKAGIPAKIIGHSGIRHLYMSYNEDFYSRLLPAFKSDRGRTMNSELDAARKAAESKMKYRLKSQLREQDFWPAENKNIIMTNDSHIDSIGFLQNV